MCSGLALFWIEILSVNGIGAGSWLRLSKSVEARRIISMLRSAGGRGELERLIGRKVDPPDRKSLDAQHAFIGKKRCGAICIDDPIYPPLLREIPLPPPLLFYSGDPSVLKGPAVCVVGSRNACRRGLLMARRIGGELAAAGYLVVSGMARGIDGMAHEGAIDGGGKTAAVLGCGVDVPYPPENASLAIDISGKGCIVSEFPPGTPPVRHNFPQRNRILSGLSLGVVVVEADIDSGAMGTARWAAEQGRDVFAVPGPVEHAGSRGPHRLIREGACLVENTGDILAELPRAGMLPLSWPVSGQERGADAAGDAAGSMGEAEKSVFAALEVDPKHVDELVQICHISATSILPVLLSLEMKGLVESCGGGRFALADGLGNGIKESG